MGAHSTDSVVPADGAAVDMATHDEFLSRLRTMRRIVEKSSTTKKRIFGSAMKYSVDSLTLVIDRLQPCLKQPLG